MATLSDSAKIARQLASTSATGLTTTLVVDFSNYASMKLRKMLIDKGIDACPVQESTKTLVDGQGTYLYPADMFYVPKYVEINWWTPSDQSLWVQTDKVAESNLLPNKGISWLRKNQSASKPLIDYRGDYYEILPTPLASFRTLTNALRIFYYLQPTLYTALTDTMTYPESLDYFSFGELVKNLYLYSLEKITKDDMEKSFIQEVGKLVSIIQGDGSSPTRAKGLRLTGFEF